MASRNWPVGSTPAWRRFRLVILERDGYRCRIALEGSWPVFGGTARCLGKADCVHHTLGRGVTGDDPRYCVAACSPCNRRVGDPTRVPDPSPKKPRW
jgi:hypothetical protein